ncbi:hypothetical protein phD2B_004 [Lelliottia phage phD2B]|uniref:Uncharacterized protein n=1 Tax=Lelliottia phage phD2B TaxID=1542498 RepID=A0A088FS97_9CAUD|nr:hypothetical protein phD2B_004 [Lelliottia phage phD2B]AIM51231.1 hypothetical protein phD2B_004 [Lelliottia phage phD2B]
MSMYTHEIYTESSSAAYHMVAALKGSSVQSYNIAPDTEMYVVSVVRCYGHTKMVNMLASLNLNFEEVITINF